MGMCGVKWSGFSNDDIKSRFFFILSTDERQEEGEMRKRIHERN
jgi:hypothetical protein